MEKDFKIKADRKNKKFTQGISKNDFLSHKTMNHIALGPFTISKALILSNAILNGAYKIPVHHITTGYHIFPNINRAPYMM